MVGDRVLGTPNAGAASASPGSADSAPALSVVIATYNRADSACRLLRQLGQQTIAPSQFEVIVVDDGSNPHVATQLAGLDVPYALQVVRQENAGPAAARHNALERARGAVAVLVDDDMSIEPSFLAEHAAAHRASVRRVALGPLRGRDTLALPLFERCHLALLEKLEREVKAGRSALRGTNLYTGNVSFPRADYFAVGGFDRDFRLSEDTELGVRLELAGLDFVFAEAAIAWHDSDHTSLQIWMRRSRAYGASDARVAEKHPDLASASPWRFLLLMNPLARPFLVASVVAPTLAVPAARAAMMVSTALAKVGAERLAIAGTTVVYGMLYFAGVRTHAGSLRRAGSQFRRYLARRGRPPMPIEQDSIAT